MTSLDTNRAKIRRPVDARHPIVSDCFHFARDLSLCAVNTARKHRYIAVSTGGSPLSNLNNVMKPTSSMILKSSCVGLIQAFEAWTGRQHATIGTEGMCQEIHR